MKETTSVEQKAWNIFYYQSKMFAEGETMLEDFCIKSLRRGLSEEDTVKYLGEYYHQCEQVCRENLQRSKKYI